MGIPGFLYIVYDVCVNGCVLQLEGEVDVCVFVCWIRYVYVCVVCFG